MSATLPPPPGSAPSHSPPNDPGFWSRLGIVCALAALGSAGYAISMGWGPFSRRPPVENPATALDERINVNPGYLGPQACAECHAERVADCLSSKHFRTCRVPKDGEMPPGFDSGRGIYTARSAGVQFDMRRVPAGYVQTTAGSGGVGSSRRDTSIDLVLGAGAADDVYLSWRSDGSLYELPVAWLWTTERWASSHFCTAYGEGDRSREMTARCMECHTTWMEHVPTTNLFRQEGAILGVTCERCHGPGQAHVEHHRRHPDETLAARILNPISLDREREIEVCTQCHSNSITHRQPPFSYRPGEPLQNFFRTQTIAHSENDHVADQITHLRQSRCFQEDSSLTCLSCHDPHQRPELQPRAQVCAKCHAPSACGEQPRLAEGVRARCIECHMPARLKINVKFEIEGDNFVPPLRRYQHRIGVDTVARDEVLWEWHRSQPGEESTAEAARLSRQLVTHWLEEANRMRAERRFMAAICAVREALRIEESDETRELLQNLVGVQEVLYDGWAQALSEIQKNQPRKAQETLEKLLRIDPNSAEYHAKLGTLHAVQGQQDSAVVHLARVQELDPNNTSGLGVMGRIAFQNKKFDVALELWSQAAELEPFLSQIQYDLGMALLELKRPAEAVEKFERARSIEPARIDVHIGLTEAYLAVGQWDLALASGTRAGELSEGGDPKQSEQIAGWMETVSQRAESGRRGAGFGR